MSFGVASGKVEVNGVGVPGVMPGVAGICGWTETAVFGTVITGVEFTGIVTVIVTVVCCGVSGVAIDVADVGAGVGIGAGVGVGMAVVGAGVVAIACSGDGSEATGVCLPVVLDVFNAITPTMASANTATITIFPQGKDFIFFPFTSGLPQH